MGRALIRSLTEKIGQFADEFDVLIPLPVTDKRLTKRGFNQCFVMCEEMSRLTGKPIEHGSLRKVRETADQFTLSRADRKRNVRGAFSVTKDGGRLKGKRLLLVDDLYTTGNTAREAAKALQPLKPAEILFFALARTPE